MAFGKCAMQSSMLSGAERSVAIKDCIARPLVPLDQLQPTRGLSPKESVAVQALIAAKLKDPDSAKFTDMKLRASADGVRICGTINAKNSFGGYTGAQRFYLVASPELVARSIEIDNVQAPYAEGACRGLGM